MNEIALNWYKTRSSPNLKEHWKAQDVLHAYVVRSDSPIDLAILEYQQSVRSEELNCERQANAEYNLAKLVRETCL